MKKIPFTICCIMATGMSLSAQTASQTFVPNKAADRTVYFCTDAEGESLPILWGLDTAWPDEGNIRRGVRFMGPETVGVARVSFQPWDYMNTTTLTPRLESNLVERLRLVSLINGVGGVDLVLNNDGPLEECDTRYQNAANDPNAARAYANLIYSTMLSCQAKGWKVITASPLNEPDYQWNGQGSMEDFLAIAQKLKTYPQFKTGDVRISGGNTLNCDCALPWYEFLYDYIDEGNTHQLAGDFDHYADFFARVRADGKYATADELHNVMEAMVGVEYGMQTGIWWGTAEYTRGEFCKASFGQRLAYAENRKAWSSAAVYRAPQGKVQAFVGSSERQAEPCTYRFVSQDRDVYYDGYGPMREYTVSIPGGYGYQVPNQTNAECVVDINWGEDVRPMIDGNYVLMNKMSQKVMGVESAVVNAAVVVQTSPGVGASLWEIKPVPNTIGGDFSYFSIKLAEHNNMKLDIINWSLDEKGGIIIYDGGLGGNEQWFFKYAGDGYFRIFSRHSALCLEVSDDSKSDGIRILQASPSDNPRQLWRLLPADAECEIVAPEAPTSLVANAQSASVALSWTASPSSDVNAYVVLRADAGSEEFNTIARGVEGTTFVDNTVVPGQKYQYKVKAVDRSLNTSEASNIVASRSLSDDAMVARYLFDKSDADETANRFDAKSAEGARTKYAEGKVDGMYALNLVGSRFVQLPYQVANYDNLTVSMWINLRARETDQHIFDFGRDAEHFAALSIGNNCKLVMTVRNGDNEQTIEGAQLVANEWHHVAVTISAGRVAIFVDGKQSAEAPAGMGATLADLCPVLNYVGCSQDMKAAKCLTGQIQDLRIYNYAVADAAMPQLMNIGAGVTSLIVDDSPIVATEYYNMQGQRIPQPSGVTIVRNIHADGTSSCEKVTAGK